MVWQSLSILGTEYCVQAGVPPDTGSFVVYELGMMQLLKRPCIILKHAALRKMPTDLLSMLYEGYSSKEEAIRKLGEWWERTNT